MVDWPKFHQWILLIRLKDFRWQSGEITQNNPEIHAGEWPNIMSHCTEQEFQFLINLKEDPKVAMPKQFRNITKI